MSYSTSVNNDSQSHLLGLIGAMKDGMIASFEHKGVWIYREGESAAVSPTGPPQDIQGGRHLLKGASLNELAEWIEAKVEYYGD